MSMALLIIGLVSAVSSFISFRFNRRFLAVIQFLAAISLVALSYWANVQNEEQKQRTQPKHLKTVYW